MTPADRTRWLCERARTIGLDLCGVTQSETLAASPEIGEQLPEWLRRGYAGEMNYLRDPRRADPRSVMDEARSIIVVALNYNSPEPYSTDRRATRDEGGGAPRGWISRYAWGSDYHEVIRDKLETLIAAMRAQFEESFEARAYVDTGPVIERVAAKYAGLGWLAKNTCLINEGMGSWLFLGVVLTTLELAPTLAEHEWPPPDLCGNCTLCLDACPTEAFVQPYVLDARRCISYLTIELRRAIAPGFRAMMGDAVFGCDICQDVCPWNRKAPAATAADFRPREMQGGEATSLFAPELEWLTELSQAEFSEVFRRSAVKRAKWRGLVRNACIALGNARLPRGAPARPRVVALLDRLASSDDALIAEHAKWALERLGAGD